MASMFRRDDAVGYLRERIHLLRGQLVGILQMTTGDVKLPRLWIERELLDLEESLRDTSETDRAPR